MVVLLTTAPVVGLATAPVFELATAPVVAVLVSAAVAPVPVAASAAGCFCNRAMMDMVPSFASRPRGFFAGGPTGSRVGAAVAAVSLSSMAASFSAVSALAIAAGFVLQGVDTLAL